MQRIRSAEANQRKADQERRNAHAFGKLNGPAHQQLTACGERDQAAENKKAIIMERCTVCRRDAVAVDKETRNLWQQADPRITRWSTVVPKVYADDLGPLLRELRVAL